MKAISRRLDRFCYKHPNFGIPNLMQYVAMGSVIIFVGDLLTSGAFSWFTRLYPELILKGQVWRLVSFIFVPVSTSGSTFMSCLLFAISTFFYYQIGTMLERQWGTARFNLFYFIGVAMNLIVGLVLYALSPITHDLLGGYYFETANMYYVNLSMFFSFATLYPDVRVLLYGIFPVKIKWLAYLDVFVFAYDILQYLANGNWLRAVLPVIALLNYFLFFGEDLLGLFRRKEQHIRRRTDPQVVNFKQAQKDIQQRKGYLHKCAVCGVTDADDPDMEFRYCSKCNGYYCYCSNHISNHTHVE